MQLDRLTCTGPFELLCCTFAIAIFHFSATLSLRLQLFIFSAIFLFHQEIEFCDDKKYFTLSHRFKHLCHFFKNPLILLPVFLSLHMSSGASLSTTCLSAFFLLRFRLVLFGSCILLYVCASLSWNINFLLDCFDKFVSMLFARLPVQLF